MAKKKKITRKELLNKPDEFITFSSKMIEFATVHQTQLFFGFLIFIVLVVSAVGIRYYSNKAEKQASDMLAMMMSKYEFIKNKSGPEIAYNAVEKESKVLLNEFSNKDGGKLARVMYADICYQSGKIDKAIELYTKALNYFNDDSAVRYFILNGLGYCYEEKSDYKTAAGYFQQVVDGRDNAMTCEALYNLGRIYGEMGDDKKSLASYQRVLSDYSDSVYVEFIRERIHH